MLFTCQRSGKCCTHPQIVVTLTHKDLWELFQESQGIEELKQLIQFMVIKKNEDAERLVLRNIKTIDGHGSFILRKTPSNKCIFYNEQELSCNIHTIRPQACRNFPFAFNKDKNQLSISLVKNASSFCMGIGKGKEYTKEELQNIGNYTLRTIEEFNSIVDEINTESDNNKPLTPHDALMTLLLVAEKNKATIEEELQIL